MVQPLSLLGDRARENWLIGLAGQQLVELAEIRYNQLLNFPTAAPTVLISEADSLALLAGFIAACTAHCPVYLCNPNWSDAEQQQVMRQVQPDLVWGNGMGAWQKTEGSRQNGKTAKQNHLKFSSVVALCAIQNSKSLSGWIMIPTGGSSGRIRFAVHTWETLMASVVGFQQYFQVEQINSCCVLPLYHVSGLMQFMRSFTSGGQLALLPSQALETGTAAIDPENFFLSLVPTQLQRLLQRTASSNWLRRFCTVLLGGAPAWTELLETARQQQIRLAPTYGMTETASQVATLQPEDFLRGQTGCGQVLPHAHITIQDQDGRSLPPNQIGTVTIQSASLALGYYPDLLNSCEFQTDDLGYFDAAGYLHLVGRSSHKIITGGENVFPVEVEAAIRSTGLVNDVCVLGLPDADWGEAVTAAYVPVAPEVTIAHLQAALASQLSKFKQPKRWIALDQLPRNAQGKVIYETLKRMKDKG